MSSLQPNNQHILAIDKNMAGPTAYMANRIGVLYVPAGISSVELLGQLPNGEWRLLALVDVTADEWNLLPEAAALPQRLMFRTTIDWPAPPIVMSRAR